MPQIAPARRRTAQSLRRAEIVVPAAHVFAWRRQACALPLNFEQAILAQVEEKCVVLTELPLERTGEQLNLTISEPGKASLRSE